MDYSKKTGDAWQTSFTYAVAWNVAQYGILNPHLAIEHAKQMAKYGTTAKDNFLIGHANGFLAHSLMLLSRFMEDPDKQKEALKKVEKISHEASYRAHIIDYKPILFVSYPMQGDALTKLAAIETDPERKRSVFERAIEVMQKGSEHLKPWNLHGVMLISLSDVMFSFSETKRKIEEKRKLLHHSQAYAREWLAVPKGDNPAANLAQSRANYRLALAQEELAKIETDDTEKVELLSKALTSIENSIKIIEKGVLQTDWTSGYCYGRYYEELGRILQQIHFLTKEKNPLSKAIEAYEKASFDFNRAKLPTNEAESYWHAAQLYDQLDKHQDASKNYEAASQAYDLAAKKIPQLKGFYKDYSLYMQGWSQIEQARNAHSMEEYTEAQEHYEKAAELHESTEQWKYLTPNYSAWADMEEAESLSRKENTQQAKRTFQKALHQFTIAEKSIKQKLQENTASNEKEIIHTLLKASDLRRKYCQARILMEDAKLLDRKGRYRQSSKSYAEAADNIKAIIGRVDVEAERKELRMLATLCQAWEKLAKAEETSSSEAYLKAARLFEQAKEHCFTRKASLWVLGNSNFCKGLAAGTEFQSSMDLKDNALAKRYIKSAASSYLQAGFKGASEYAKATQRLFDAYVFINQAESEIDPESKTKQYQMAEKLLQISASSFMKAKQPEKTAQVQQILNTVGEEKALADSLNEVLHAPALTSSTLSFTAPTPTSETSVGLESFEHANVQANLVVGLKKVRVGESFCLSVEFVNAGKEPALLTRVEDIIPPGFVVVKKPEIYRLEESCLNMKGKQIAPLKLVEAKVVLQPSRKGLYQLNPKVHYLDENGQSKSLQLKLIEIKVEEVVLANRVSTGTKELDSLLLGGIPEEYSVVLTGPPSDERELIIRNFLQAGAGQTSFYASTEADGLEALLQKPNFYLFLCNPRPKVKVPDLPNVYKLHSKSDINNLHIALVKAYRTVNKSSRKRICVNVVSDVLVEYRVRTTRKWLAELTTDLISKGFTILAVVNPQMHTPEEHSSVLDLFDGEISLTQTEDPLECKKSIRIRKLRNQDYIKNPICLTK